MNPTHPRVCFIVYAGVFLMLCKPKPSMRRRKIRRVMITIAAVAILLSVFLELAVKSQLKDVVTAQMKTVAQRAANSAVTEVLSQNPDIGKMLTAPQTADDGRVTSITSDPAAVNMLKASISELTQQRIGQLAQDEGLSVPLGNFSGFFLFAELGPEIRMRIGSRQTVTCSLNNVFESAGVNQTLHHIILTVDIEIVVYNPFRIRRAIHTSADFEIAQTVIVGSVPNYTYGSLIQ